MKCNGPELDAEVRAKIEAGWFVTSQFGSGTLEWIVIDVDEDGITLYVWSKKCIRGRMPPQLFRSDAIGAKPHKHAPAYKFGEPDTVTREEARKMFVGDWRAFDRDPRDNEWFVNELGKTFSRDAWESYDITYIKSPVCPPYHDGNGYRIVEAKPC